MISPLTAPRGPQLSRRSEILYVETLIEQHSYSLQSFSVLSAHSSRQSIDLNYGIGFRLIGIK